MWAGRAAKTGLLSAPSTTNSLALLRPTKYLLSLGYQMENSSPVEANSTMLVLVRGFCMFSRKASGVLSRTYPGALRYSWSLPDSILPDVKLTLRVVDESDESLSV